MWRLRRLWCRWFGHRPEKTPCELAAWVKVPPGPWERKAKTVEVAICGRCGEFLEPLPHAEYFAMLREAPGLVAPGGITFSPEEASLWPAPGQPFPGEVIAELPTLTVRDEILGIARRMQRRYRKIAEG